MTIAERIKKALDKSTAISYAARVYDEIHVWNCKGEFKRLMSWDYPKEDFTIKGDALVWAGFYYVPFA